MLIRYISDSIKRIISEPTKRRLRRIEDYIRRYRFGHTRPVVLEDAFGIKFILTPQNHNPLRWQLQSGTYVREFDTIRKIVKKNDLVFDVGANNGFLTVFLSKCVGSGGKVYSFEPNPEARKEFKKNIALNELENVNLSPSALSSQVGTTQLNYVPDNHRLSSLAPISNTHYGENKTMVVGTDTIDNYCAQNHIDRIDFLKIDVEGLEYEVLWGAQRMLKSHAIAAVQFEMWERNEKLLNLLYESGYEIDYSYTNSSNYYAFSR
ncbi:MAG TPA: FkbM family methyltransferase [Candidatus Paceibacterota bacterium]|nr:FkbM family methyltransferase [Candidatus Paceibacterota bacterium]